MQRSDTYVLYLKSEAVYQVAGADLAVGNPSGAALAFAALQVKFGDTAAAARWLSSSRHATACGLRTRLSSNVRRLQVH